MVLDTDAKNEIDDQFAITFALLSERLQVEALYATQFSHDPGPKPSEGMELSYREILTIQDKLGLPERVPVFRGVAGLLGDVENPRHCEAADDLIRRALCGDEVLYVVAIGALTNVASAILLEPRIIERIVLVWLGGNTYDWGSIREYNLMGDFKASQVIFDSGVPLIRFPCFDVASVMLLDKEELNANIRPYGAIGAYLGEIFDDYPRVKREGRSCIWDLSTVAFMENPGRGDNEVLPMPRLTEDLTWNWEGEDRPLHRVVTSLRRDAIFNSLYEKLRKHASTTQAVPSG
ncbi:MAG: nucleoside hydrolase [bacterium]